MKNVTDAAKGAGKVAQKLLKVAEALKNIYDKIAPVLKRLKTISVTVKKVIDTFSKVDKKTGTAKSKTAKTQRPDTQFIDMPNAIAEWRCFNIEIDYMEESLSTYGISGKNEYFQALRKMVVKAETYILTQASLVQRADDYVTVLMQQSMGERDESRLSTAATRIANNTEILTILTRAMFDRVLAIRHQVYLDFHAFTEAYRYHTLSDPLITDQSPIKSIGDYQEGMAKLCEAITVFSAMTNILRRTFRLNVGPSELSTEARVALGEGQAISFDIDRDAPLWNGFARIRMTCARCWLEGITTESNLPVRLELGTDAQFVDRNPTDPAPAHSSSTVSDRTPEDIDEDLGEDRVLASLLAPTMRYVGVARKLLFEYEPRSKAIHCDGVFSEDPAYTRFTPITRWSVRVVEGGSDSAKRGEIDFTGFTGITMEFMVDCARKGPFIVVNIAYTSADAIILLSSGIIDHFRLDSMLSRGVNRFLEHLVRREMDRMHKKAWSYDKEPGVRDLESDLPPEAGNENNFLSWLWYTCVKPILKPLAAMRRAESGGWAQVWLMGFHSTPPKIIAKTILAKARVASTM
ncbi:hypothetical protein BO86DRAFT_395756 [Aspergillus japonicus CBS 114.51]|uniref:Uncharacterized protein n=1 Tax=Aspergillus japonicus CBS 114.51 TaxID=1448312 RepID=A0A8T8XE45_ASPJA|nr:hypothetical protein BO86DRAFT_395756 [Aspergillus japonicus CBS 114.51]RAH86320.1 hypothetical protein BO86DRAFT_395756 [Aspergillus japonicus CBS 114.51]